MQQCHVTWFTALPAYSQLIFPKCTRRTILEEKTFKVISVRPCDVNNCCAASVTKCGNEVKNVSTVPKSNYCIWELYGF